MNTCYIMKLFQFLVQRFFCVTGAAEHSQDVSHEHSIYRDIVQENFIDSYVNSTLKAVMAFRWARTFCRNAQYVLIANDDVVVDVFKLIPYLETFKSKSDTHQICVCYLYPCCMLADNYSSNFTATRHKSKKKVKLKLEEVQRAYHGKAYPAHCSGSAFVAPSLSINNLYLMSLDTPSFIPYEPWIGVLAEKLGITFKDTFASFVGIPAVSNLLLHFTGTNYLETPILVAVVGPSYPNKEAEKMRRIWGLILTHHRDKPSMDVHQYMGIKREKDNHIYTVAAAALLIDLFVISLIGYIIFCRKKLRPYLQHPVSYRRDIHNTL